MTDAQKARLPNYDAAVDLCSDFDRKGKSMPYTSANGYMFSQLNKDGEIGVRLSPDAYRAFREAHGDRAFRSYGSVMREYVLVPDDMVEKPRRLAGLLNDGYAYVTSLPPK